MAKWVKRLDKIIKQEQENSKCLNKFKNTLKEKIHGNDNIDKNYMESLIKGICSDYQNDELNISLISVEYRFKNSPKDSMLFIKIRVNGIFNGFVTVETSSGYRNTENGRLDIYYIMYDDIKIRSDKVDKICSYYKSLKLDIVNAFTDILLDTNFYLNYEDCYKSYELWDRETDQYEDLIAGDIRPYNDDINFKKYYQALSNVRKLHKTDDLKEFAKNHLYDSHQSYTYKWIEYKLL